jgi:hypothetical protein
MQRRQPRVQIVSQLLEPLMFGELPMMDRFSASVSIIERLLVLFLVPAGEHLPLTLDDLVAMLFDCLLMRINVLRELLHQVEQLLRVVKKRLAMLAPDSEVVVPSFNITEPSGMINFDVVWNRLGHFFLLVFSTASGEIC